MYTFISVHLGGLAAFFCHSLKCTKLLNELCEKRMSHVTPTRWNFSSRLVGTVCEKRARLLELFQHITDHPSDSDANSIHCTQLKTFDFCFLLLTFKEIFDFANVLFKILQNKSQDIQFCLELKIFSRTLKVSEPLKKKWRLWECKTHLEGEQGMPAITTESFTKLVESILSQITNQFEYHKRLLLLTVDLFVALLNP